MASRVLYSVADWTLSENPFDFPHRLCLVICVGGWPGSHTCGASCEHCFLLQRSQHGKVVTHGNLGAHISAERKLIASLKAAGHYVIPMLPDTFSWDGTYMRERLVTNSPLYDDQETLEDKGIAWSSGLPLLSGNAYNLLHLAASSGHSVLSLSCHGLQTGDSLFRGVPPPEQVARVIEVVKGFNHAFPDKAFEICVTFTLGKHNSDQLERYIEAGKELSCNYVRFNRFIDFSRIGKHKHLMFDREDNFNFFRWIASWNSDANSMYPKIMISTDFGYVGTETLGLPFPVNHCPGGRGLFCLADGIIYPCNECLTYPVGQLSVEGDQPSLRFDADRIDVVRQLLNSPGFDGCIGHSLVVHGFTQEKGDPFHGSKAYQ